MIAVAAGDEAGPARIRLVLYSDAVELGGAERSVGNLLSALSAHVEPTVLGVDEHVAAWIAGFRPGTPIELVPPVRDKRDLGGIVAHVRALRRLRPDVFHANLRIPWSCQYGLLAAAATPRVRTIAVEQAPVPAANGLQRALKRLLSRRLDAHVAGGEKLARLVEELAGLEPGSIRTIPNSVPDLPVEPEPRAASGHVIGCLGRLSAEKGFDVLLRALELLPETTCVIVGDGPERSRLDALARELGVADRLIVTGWSEKPRSYLPSFDVFVLPSRFEGLPLAVLEAMLAERPVVASDVGSVPEAVHDGDTGLLVPPEDPVALAGAIRRLLEEPELRARMGACGRELALRRFATVSVAAAFEALYAEVLG